MPFVKRNLMVVVCVLLLLQVLSGQIASAGESPQRQDIDCGYPNSVRDGLSAVQYFQMAMVYARQFRLKQAKSCLAKLQSCKPTADAKEKAMIIETTVFPKESLPQAESLIQQGSDALIAEDRIGAKKLATECIEKYPNFESAYLLKAKLEGSFFVTTSREINDYEKVLKINPKNVFALEGCASGSLSGRTPKPKEAAEYLRKIHLYNPFYWNDSLELLEGRCNMQTRMQETRGSLPGVGSNSTAVKPSQSTRPTKPRTAGSNKLLVSKVPAQTTPKKLSQSIPRAVAPRPLDNFIKAQMEKPYVPREYHFIDKSGQKAFEPGPNVEFAYGFSDGLMIINAAEGRGVNCGNGITQWWRPDGELGFDVTVRDGFSSSDGLCGYSDSLRWGFLNHNGEKIVPAKYVRIRRFSDERAGVQVDGHWGFIDKKGTLVIEPIYDEVLPFSQGLAAVEIAGKIGFIDKAGKLAISPDFDLVRSFSNGLAKTVKFEGADKLHHIAYVDQKGRPVVDVSKINSLYRKEGSYQPKGNDGYFDDEWTLVARKNSFGVGKPNDGEEDFHEGVLATGIGGGVGYIDSKGKVVIPPMFNRADKFSDGRALAMKDGKFGYLDHMGAFVIAPKFKDAKFFSNGLAAVTMDGEHWGYIDTSGKMVIKDDYLEAFPFCEGLAKVGVAQQ
jgi:hypothetical protein